MLLGLINDLKAVNDSKTAVTDSVSALSTALSAARTAIDQTFTDCGVTCSPALDTSDMVVNFDPTTVSLYEGI